MQISLCAWGGNTFWGGGGEKYLGGGAHPPAPQKIRLCSERPWREQDKIGL
jgi:hypothetical protein